MSLMHRPTRPLPKFLLVIGAYALAAVVAGRALAGAASMTRYKNLHGNSGVTAYEIGRASITVEFGDGGRYLYTYESAGRTRIERMKLLARAGTGLSAFISRHVRDAYAARLR